MSVSAFRAASVNNGTAAAMFLTLALKGCSCWLIPVHPQYAHWQSLALQWESRRYNLRSFQLICLTSHIFFLFDDLTYLLLRPAAESFRPLQKQLKSNSCTTFYWKFTIFGQQPHWGQWPMVPPYTRNNPFCLSVCFHPPYPGLPAGYKVLRADSETLSDGPRLSQMTPKLAPGSETHPSGSKALPFD